MPADPLLKKENLLAYLRSHKLDHLKRLSQHFLIDNKALEGMLKSINSDPTLPVIEVGAGLGILTKALTEHRLTLSDDPAPIYAVEIDRRLAPLLKERLSEYQEANVVQADILNLDPFSIFAEKNYEVVGNIPYAITKKLIRHVLEWNPMPRSATFMLDKDVAAQIAADPPHMTYMGLWVQLRANANVPIKSIPPSSFFPPPKVSSAILSMEPKSKHLLSPEEEKEVLKVARAAFNQKRKTIQNSLSSLWRCSGEEAGKKIKQASIDPSRRPQTLTIEEWKKLAGNNKKLVTGNK